MWQFTYFYSWLDKGQFYNLYYRLVKEIRLSKWEWQPYGLQTIQAEQIYCSYVYDIIQISSLKLVDVTEAYEYSFKMAEFLVFLFQHLLNIYH